MLMLRNVAPFETLFTFVTLIEMENKKKQQKTVGYF